MREIEFRGLDKNNIWCYGYLVRAQFGAWDADKHPECDNNRYLEYETLEHLGKPETISYGYQIINKNGHSYSWVKIKSIGQYTGLKDKQNKEIYEGDVIKWQPKEPFEAEIIMPVVFHNGCFATVSCCGHTQLCWCGYIKDGLEIIGNIYENPELLKGD